MLVAHASTGLCARVNKELAIAHNVTGEHIVPPFTEDQTDGQIPGFKGPRDLDLLIAMEG